MIQNLRGATSGISGGTIQHLGGATSATSGGTIQHLGSVTNAASIDISTANVISTIDRLPFPIRLIIAPLKQYIIDYLVKTDDTYDIDVADENMSDSECYSVLRTIGAQMEKFQKTNVCEYFDKQEKTFEKKIWSISDLTKYVGDIVDFCACAYVGLINKNALTSVITSMLKTQVGEEMTELKKTENIVIFSEKIAQCGIIRLEMNGYQKISTSCCATGAETKTHVGKTMIMFRDSKDLLHTLRTFAQANK